MRVVLKHPLIITGCYSCSLRWLNSPVFAILLP